MDRLIVEGLDAVYRMDFSAADEASRKAIALNPEYPHAYLGQAATDFIRWDYGSEQSDDSLTKTFDAKVDRAIEVSERWLKTHPGDADALLILGSAYGISASLALDRREWLRSFRHGSRSMKYIRASLRSDPAIYDSYLGLGMFDYYTDTIPRFAGWLAKIMLGGSRERGIKELRLAAEQGRYAATAAQMILVGIYAEDAYGARDPAEAARLMDGIRAKYPDSAMLHAASIVARYEARGGAAVLDDAKDYLARAQSGRYPATTMSKAHCLLGTILWSVGRKEEALTEFRAGAENPGPPTRWTGWSRVREGEVLDALGRREEALKVYREVGSDSARWDYRAFVKPCLSKPCVGEKYPGHFSPY
jgi:tetratricopeptide (TPR) repeat protein